MATKQANKRRPAPMEENQCKIIRAWQDCTSMQGIGTTSTGWGILRSTILYHLQPEGERGGAGRRAAFPKVTGKSMREGEPCLYSAVYHHGAVLYSAVGGGYFRDP